MVTMANNTTLERLKDELEDVRGKLEHLEIEQWEIESRIFALKETIADTRIKLQTEVLPTGLYNKGYKLREEERKFYLSDRYGEEYCSFDYTPSLSAIMEIESQINPRIL